MPAPKHGRLGKVGRLVHLKASATALANKLARENEHELAKISLDIASKLQQKIDGHKAQRRKRK